MSGKFKDTVFIANGTDETQTFKHKSYGQGFKLTEEAFKEAYRISDMREVLAAGLFNNANPLQRAIDEEVRRLNG